MNRLRLLASISPALAIGAVIVFSPDVLVIVNHSGVRTLLAAPLEPTAPRVLPSYMPADCAVWQPVRHAWFCLSPNEAGAPSFEGRELLGPLDCGGRTHAQLCRSELRRLLIVGPFFSRPG